MHIAVGNNFSILQNRLLFMWSYLNHAIMLTTEHLDMWDWAVKQDCLFQNGQFKEYFAIFKWGKASEVE